MARRSDIAAIERKVSKLELHSLHTVEESVASLYERVPSGSKSKPRWTPEDYPTGSEKELYAEFGYVMLSDPLATVPALLDSLGSAPFDLLRQISLVSRWRAFRISTVRAHREVPICFPGGSGEGGIADVGLFGDPLIDASLHQMWGAPILYFELKSQDRHAHKRSQILSHLKALESSSAGPTYLGAVGGRPIKIKHPRWIGHISLDRFFETVREVAESQRDAYLCSEIDLLRRRRSGAAAEG